MPSEPNTHRRQWLLRGAGALATLAAPGAFAQAKPSAPPELQGEWPGSRLQGSGRLRFLGLHVYDIRLWTSDTRFTETDWAQTPLALEIEYARALVGKLIAERSIEEMRRAGPIAPEAETRWLATMTSLFPDVKAGDRITGLQRPGGASRFFHNGNLRGEVRESEFTRRFFGIWLAPTTSEPRLRESLLGKS